MAEDGTNNAAAATAAGSPPAAPAQPAAAGQFHQVSDEDMNRYKRYEQVARGATPLYDRLSKLGISKPEDLDRYAPVFRTLAEKRIDPSGFSRMFSPEADQDLSGGKPADKPKGGGDDDIEQRVLSKVERKFAEREHQSAESRHSQMVEELVKELAPDADEIDREDVRAVVEWHLEKNRSLYPDEHPLRNDYLKPYGSDDLKRTAEWYKERQAKRAGLKMEAKAKAATAGAKVKPPAGNSAGQGKPTGTDQPTRPGTPEHRAKMEALYEQRLAARGTRR